MATRYRGWLPQRRQHSLQLHVTDTMGKSVTESLVLQVGGPNNAPSCEITSPANETGVPLGSSVNFLGIATDPDISPFWSSPM